MTPIPDAAVWAVCERMTKVCLRCTPGPNCRDRAEDTITTVQRALAERGEGKATNGS